MTKGEHVYIWGQIEPFRADIVTIGNYVVLGAGSVILTHCPISFYNGKDVSIVIGDNVYIGAGCCILPGAKIGNNVMIGAGSVVTNVIPSHVVAAGNPCRVIREITDIEARRIKLMTEQGLVANGQEPDWGMND